MVKRNYTGVQSQSSQMDPAVRLLGACAGALSGLRPIGFLANPTMAKPEEVLSPVQGNLPTRDDLHETFRVPMSPSNPGVHPAQTDSPLGPGELMGRAGGNLVQELLFQSPGGCDRGTARSCPLEEPTSYSHRWSFGSSCNGRCSPGQIPVQ